MTDLIRSDNEQAKEIDTIINTLLVATSTLQGRATQQIVMSAVLQYTAFMLLNATEGDKHAAMRAWESSADPIVRQYLKDADKWIARIASMTSKTLN